MGLFIREIDRIPVRFVNHDNWCVTNKWITNIVMNPCIVNTCIMLPLYGLYRLHVNYSNDTILMTVYRREIADACNPSQVFMIITLYDS